MNYSALIENRKSVREFTEKKVPQAFVQELEGYFNTSVLRLIPEIKTELLSFGTEAREALEGAAGYNQFLVGAPQYLVLLSEKAPLAAENAGFIMEDLVLKLTDMDLNSCWVTFTDSNAVKTALGLATDLEVMAIVAFGYGVRTTKRLRLNILSMSNVNIEAKRRYFEPKRGIYDMVFLNTWGNTRNLDAAIGFYDEMLWEAFHAATLSPSYLNRQAYGFLLHDGQISLIRRPDLFTTELDGKLSLGIVLHHFTSVAQQWSGKVNWHFGDNHDIPVLPQGHEVICTTNL